MNIVLLTALGVGGATVIGALAGFLFKNISHRVNDLILSFAAGVMLCAAVFGLIAPSMEHGGSFSVLILFPAILYSQAFIVSTSTASTAGALSIISIV